MECTGLKGYLVEWDLQSGKELNQVWGTTQSNGSVSEQQRPDLYLDGIKCKFGVGLQHNNKNMGSTGGDAGSRKMQEKLTRHGWKSNQWQKEDYLKQRRKKIREKDQVGVWGMESEDLRESRLQRKARLKNEEGWDGRVDCRNFERGRRISLVHIRIFKRNKTKRVGEKRGKGREGSGLSISLQGSKKRNARAKRCQDRKKTSVKKRA